MKDLIISNDLIPIPTIVVFSSSDFIKHTKKWHWQISVINFQTLSITDNPHLVLCFHKSTKNNETENNVSH
jgi:hypothetical protein